MFGVNLAQAIQRRPRVSLALESCAFNHIAFEQFSDFSNASSC
jgi:hypothetical protein